MLGTTARGVSRSSLKSSSVYKGRKILPPSSRAPFGVPDPVVEAPSVFVASPHDKVVIRPLTVEELMRGVCSGKFLSCLLDLYTSSCWDLLSRRYA